MWYYFLSSWITSFNISCISVWLAINSLGFCLSETFFSFFKHFLLGRWEVFFPFRTVLKVLSHCLLVYIISEEKIAIILNFIPLYIMFLLVLWQLLRFSPCNYFQQFDYDVPWGNFLPVSSTWEFLESVLL